MKNTMWKRALALLFALTLILSLAVPAMAEEPEEDAAPPETDAEPTPDPEPTPAPETTPDPAPVLTPVGDEEAAASEAAYRELYVSRDGSDETGDGSEAAPLASLAAAAEAANDTPEIPVFILLLTDLDMEETARFLGRDVTIQAAGEPVTVTRAQGFRPDRDEQGAQYNPPMLQLARPDKDHPAGTLTLIGVILDDAGRREGERFAQSEEPVPEEALAEEPADAATEAADPVEAEDDAPAEAPAESPAPADRLDLVQDAIVSVEEGGSLILSTGAELRNFGGQSAVSLGEGSKLTLEADSAIRDTMEMENGLPAISAPASAKVEKLEGAKLIERAAPAEEALQPQDILPVQDDTEGGFSSITFVADPEVITRLVDSSWLQYPVSYELHFSVSERLQGLIEGAQSLITGSEGTVTVKLDPRLTLDLSGCTLTSSVFELDGDPVFDESTHTLSANFKLKEDWASHLEELTQPMVFRCGANLSFTDFTASTAEKDEFLISTGSVSLALHTESRTIGPYSSTEKEARIKMLGIPTATVVYDVNGGDAGSGPASEFPVSETASHPLLTEPKPSHAPQDGVDVIFLGWTAEPDPHIYAHGEEKPATIESVAISTLGTVTVYAVYGSDTNGDGIADVEQRLATLSFDANGGENAPDPIIHVVGSTESGDLGVNIPEQEPNRDYYSFLGWGETADATKDDKLYKYDADKEGRRDIPVTKDTTLYAVWEKNYQINYDANGGSNAPAATVLLTQTKTGTDSKGNPVYKGRAVITSGVPTRSGYSFQGWATSRRGAAAYFAGDEVEISGGNVTLYAVWARDGSGGGGSNAPKTGDSAPGLWASLLGLSALGLAVAGARLRKKAQSE